MFGVLIIGYFCYMTFKLVSDGLFEMKYKADTQRMMKQLNARK